MGFSSFGYFPSWGRVCQPFPISRVLCVAPCDNFVMTDRLDVPQQVALHGNRALQTPLLLVSFFFSVFGVELRTSRLLGRGSTH
jgi:hypothetical protein